MDGLMIGISGVRGIVGETLTPELLTRLGQAFGSYVSGGEVVVGRDTRVSGEMVKHSVLGGLLAAGCGITDIGIVSTPTLTLIVEEEEDAAGGIMISASHNPAEWNALKFFEPDGIYLDDRQMRIFLDIYYQGDFLHATYDRIKVVRTLGGAVERHMERLLALIDREKIASKPFRVTVDCCNGAGIEGSMYLLDRLGARVDPLHCVPDGLFPHDPEPTFKNLTDLIKRMQESGSDIGFAQDPDGDRLAVVDEKGRFIGEEYTLALAVEYVLSKGETKGPVVVNLSTSRVIEDIAGRYGVELVRVPVGEVNVANAMREAGSVIGGEGNGGVIYGPCHFGRDSFVAMALILEYAAETGRPVSALVEALPRYHIVKDKVPCPRRMAHTLMQEIRQEAGSSRVDDRDGLRIDFDRSWVHLRPSNTEPVVRVIAEAPEKKDAEKLVADMRRRAESIIGEEAGA